MSVVSTYAEALYEAAESSGDITGVVTQLSDLREAIAQVPELAQVLSDPEVDTPAKKRTMAALLEGASPIVSGFVQVLLDRGRLDMLDEISTAFERMVAAAEGRLQVVVRTAIPLPDDLRSEVIARLERNAGGPIDVETVVDPSIVGGVIIETASARVDASVQHRLEAIQASLRSASVHHAVTTE